MSNTADYPTSVSQVPTRSLRSTVLSLTFVAFIWNLALSISSFQVIGTDDAQHQKSMAAFSIVLGSYYIGTAVICLFGFCAAASRRLALIRIFPGLTAVATVIILAASFVRTILHSALKDALITECVALATGQNVDIVLGIWGSNPGHNLTPSEANQFCKNAWSHDSYAEIFWLFVEITILPWFISVAFAYEQQESASASGRVRTSLPANYTPAYTPGGYAATSAESTEALLEVAFDKSLPGHGGGEMEKKDSDSMMTAVAEDPFSNELDEYPRLKNRS